MPKNPSKTMTVNDDELSEFQKLFWQARKDHARNSSTKAEDVSENHQAALDFAHQRGWEWGAVLLQASKMSFRKNKAANALEILNNLSVPNKVRGILLHVTGVAYNTLGEFDSAIDFFNKALTAKGFGSPGKALNSLGLAYNNKGDFERAIEYYQQALALKGYDSEGTALNNLGLAYNNKGDLDRAIDYYQQALATPGYETHGIALNNLGLAYDNRGDFDRAIEYYQQALATPGFDIPGDALNNIGLAYNNKSDFDRAIEYYRQALAMPEYDTPGITLYNIGLAYDNKREFDLAIKYYQQALSTPGYDTPGEPLNNLGTVYYSKGDFDQAIEYYLQALRIPDLDTPHLLRNNLANAYRELERFDKAKEEVNKILSEDDKEGEHSRARYILSLIKQQERKIQPTPGEKALTNRPPNDKFAALMKTLLQDKKTQYDAYIEKYRQREGEPKSNELVILRGWSSAVTLLEGATDRKWPGGGYFLRWQKKGLVIDPGFDFLDNFHEAGFHILDVHAVAVSHDHIDHNGDLRSLDDLCYETHRNSNNPRTGADKKTLFILDSDSYRRIPNATAKHRGTLGLFSMRDREDKAWFGGTRNNLPFQVEHFPVTHGKDVPSAQGFRIVLTRKDGSTLTIGYTGDTIFFPKLLDYLKDVDILLAHVSQPDPEELTNPSFRRKEHLGYNGVTKLVANIKPKLTLIGEFWAGLADLRLEIVGGVRQRTGLNSVLPACLGLRINLDDLSIRCTKCKTGCPVDRIKVAPPTSPFGDLGYLCPDCVL